MPLGFVLLDQGFKLQPREHLQQLRKNAAYSIQAEVSDPEDWFFSGNPILQYRSSAANLIWTGVVPDLPAAGVFFLLIVFLTSCAQPPDTREADTKAIKEVESAWVKTTATKDADAFV